MIEECESKSCCNFCCGKMYPFLVNMQLNYANNFTCDDAEMFTSEVHDPYARTTGA